MMKITLDTHTSDSKKQLVLLRADQIEDVWGHVLPKLEKATTKIKHFESSMAGIKRLLLMQQMQLWFAGDFEFIFLTRIIKATEGLRLCVDLIVGENCREYEDHMQMIEAWAREQGAEIAQAEIRLGLLPIAKENGWEAKRIKVFKHLRERIH